MTTGDREDILKVIADLHERYPDWRFGQLVANVAGWTGEGVWDVEDERLLQAARSHLEHLAASEPQPR